MKKSLSKYSVVFTVVLIAVYILGVEIRYYADLIKNSSCLLIYK